MNYARFLNPVSRARQFSPIRVLTALLARSPPSMISLAAGSPNPSCFPFQSAQFKLRDGTTLEIDEARMAKALQYGPTPGQSDLLKWLRTMQEELHKPPLLNADPAKGGTDFCITVGSQDAICKTFEMLVCPGDKIILDQPTYSGTLAIIRPLGMQVEPVETDHHGMIPASLRKVLSPWKPSDILDITSDLPRVLYTIPNGVNPTGSSLSLDRKKEIYEIAQDYDLLILEDDPYYFLQFQERQPSFLSMDTDGRVLRFDSFSKILSSGIRLGLVSGPQPLVERIQLHMQASVMHTPTLTQELICQLLHKWGLPGFLSHVDSVVDYYRQQKDVMIEAANEHLSDVAEWEEPVAGMFLWMKLKGVADSKALIEEKAIEKEVMLVPGCAFMVDDQAPSPFVRASFSLASPEQIRTGIQRLGELIRAEQKLDQGAI